MKLTTTILAGAGLASAAVPHARPILGRTSLFKRWEYDVCDNDCTLRDVPMPDKNNIGLPLEGYRSEQCPPLIIGDYDAPLATSRACLDFHGTNLYFNFSSFPGYEITSAVVTWKVKGVVGEPSTWTTPPPTTNIVCDPPTTPGGQHICKLPFSTILDVPSSTPLLDLFAGMCPLTDREALIFYLQLSGLAEPVGGGPAVPFTQQYPCTQREDRDCIAWNPEYPYIEVAYRCSKCEVAACPPPPSSTSTPPPPPSSTSTPPPSSTTTPPPPPSSTSTSTTTSSTSTTTPPLPVKTCDFGTAFGYLEPVGSTPRSTTLNTLTGAQGCNRWGWYSSPTLSELQSGSVSGPLYVGAGNNVISKATNVGTWTATANAAGKVTVTYLLNAPYTISEAHVNLKCVSAITKCAPGQYTYKTDSIPNASTWSTTQLNYPTNCGTGKVGLIVHAAVDVETTSTTCSAATD